MASSKKDKKTNLVNYGSLLSSLLKNNPLSSVDITGLDASTWVPVTDIYETETEIIVSVELPGVDDEDIEVSLIDNILTLKGERRANKELMADNCYRMECYHGKFTRKYNLTSLVDKESIDASLLNGILTVKLGKIDEQKIQKKHIKVKSKK